MKNPQTLIIAHIKKGTDGKDEKSMDECVGDLTYRPENIFPSHCLKHPSWRNKDQENSSKVNSILKIPFHERNPEEISFLCNWLMDVWPVAAQLGFVQMTHMLKVLKYVFYGAGEDIVVQGESSEKIF